jgi:cleavage and polyadenylation specificity factor subunit 2
LDCGWGEPYDVGTLKPLSRVAKEMDLVLLTHGNVEHAGGLPYAVRKRRKKAIFFLFLFFF